MNARLSIAILFVFVLAGCGAPGIKSHDAFRPENHCKPPSSEGPLSPGCWEPSTRERLNALIERNRGDSDAYAVFDFDYTTAIGDLSYVCMWYLLERFDIRVADFRELVSKDMDPKYSSQIDEICVLAEKLKPYAGNVLVDRSEWKDFVRCYWKFFRLLADDVGEYRAYLWRSRVFCGYTPQEFRNLARVAIVDALRYGGLVRSPDAPTEKRGLAFAPEVKELFRELRKAGISVYIVSGSFQESLQVATGPDFGFCLEPTNVFGADFKKDKSGRYTTETVEDCVRSGHKPEFIRKHIAPRHHGREPVLVAGDSMGDYTMLTEFRDVQLALLFLRNWKEQGLHDLAASGGKVVVQGRDETKGCFITTRKCISP